MTAERRAIDRGALRTEARSLEFLLKNYLKDQDFQNSTNGTILYFIDAHELKSYLKPDDPECLQGFIFEAERACPPSEQFEFEMKLRSDQILHSLLFDPGHLVAILPSHCDEVDEELAFHAGAELRHQIGLLKRARDEVRRLSHREEPRKLIARLRNTDDKTAERDLVDFFARKAPALIAVLRGSPHTTEKRLEALGDPGSNLVRVQDIDWTRLGFDVATAARLAKVWPSVERRENWFDFLVDRKERQRNSFRANRIDGEAIAYLQALNQILSESKKPSVVGRLVTRTMTLINSVIDLKPNPKIGEADFIRHPRLLARSVSRERAGDAESELMVALRTYRQQLETLRFVPDEDERRSSAPVQALVQAWYGFERARVTGDLHARTRGLAPKEEAAIGDPVVEKLLHWFGTADVADLINDELRRAVGKFARATAALEDVTVPISAQPLSHSKRLRLIPTIAGAPGPVEFDAQALRNLPSGASLTTLFENMDQTSVEPYVGWALLFACQESQKQLEDRHTDRKWGLAEIYARSAIEIGELHDSASRTRAGGHADEAYLLLAQIQRLGARPASAAQPAADVSASALQRYNSAMSLLGRFKRNKDPRWAREHAAQILELRLELRQQSGPEGSDIASGIKWIHDALEWAAKDPVLESRILELGLAYHLAASRYRDIWPDRHHGDIVVACGWHERLQDVLQRQRGAGRSREEISRRALAMEIIGFRLLQGAGGGRSSAASDSILAFARDLRTEIRPSTDRVAELIKRALDSVGRSERDLVSAPIWGSHPTEWIIELAGKSKAADLMSRGYSNLARIAGGSQKAAVTPLERGTLENIAEDFTAAMHVLDEKASQGGERALDALFYARMEVCYAKFLLALIDEDSRNTGLEQLILHYQAISEAYPQASIPHFRLDSIYSELGKNDLAFDELTQAVKLVDDDPFLRIPGHWVRSTIKRRVGSRFSEEASQQRRKLQEQPDPELRDAYLQNLLLAFRSVHASADEIPEKESDVLYALENHRRVNNIVYYASLVLEVCPGPEGFRLLNIDETEMRQLLARLTEGDVTQLSEIGFIHTIGTAYAALGEMEEAAAAGNRLVDVAKETADAARLTNVLADAFTWIQRRKLPTRNALDPIFGSAQELHAQAAPS
jgi:hypothetical protein